MTMSVPELERALRGLRLSGMIDTLEARALQVGSHEMDFLEAFSWLVQDELADILMSRYEKHSTIVTSNRPFEDWGRLLGDVVVVAPLLDRLMHHGHLLKFDGKSWRLKEAAERLAKRKSKT